ncbi:MAG: hypothetical protein ABEJ26_08105 [Halosimplex sp.]
MKDAFGDPVVIVDRTRTASDAGPVSHALDALVDAVEADGRAVERVDYWTETEADAYLVVGTTGGRVVDGLLDAGVSEPESVCYGRGRTDRGDSAVAVAGTDERGLSYALYEIAERVEARGTEALAEIEAATETPDNRVRGVDRFVETPVEDDWLYDDGFWRDYFERLARSRYNRFALVTGYDTAFMSPPYPFVVDVPGFSDVTLSGGLERGRAENRDQLRRIGDLCHEYGLEFVFGIWQQRPWIDYQDVLVEGLPDGDDLAEYCKSGLRETLVRVPEIDGVQLRVNYESGVTEDGDCATAQSFWTGVVDAVAEAREERDRDLSLNLRAKGLTDDMIDHGLERGFDVTVPTKFWCESTGLPYHNTEMRRGELDNLDDPNRSRRYSYADLLEKPRSFDVLYRLWTTGTNRVFVWGDPDYARRFAHATRFGDGAGFEVTTPLSLKGGYHGLREEGWPLFDDPDLRHYEREDERYWAWYRLFGRLGYSTDADPDAWEREFERRFGDAADAVQRGYRAASKVLPLVTAFHLTTHPALHNWAELDTGGALFAEHNYNDRFGETTYLTAEPSDPGLFYRIDEFVADDLADERQGKYTPIQVSRWLAHCATETRRAIDRADGAAPDSSEYRATALDLAMLADLAEYHAHKVRAAVALCRYRERDDPDHLPDAHASALAMREAWRSLADRGESTYHDDLVFGRGAANADAGNWTDRLVEMDADVAELERLLDEERLEPAGSPAALPDGGSGDAFGPFPHPPFDAELPEAHPADEDLDVAVRTGELDGAETVRLHYRRANQREGAFESVAMTRTDRGYEATVPAEYLSPEFDLLVYVSATDADGDAAVYPGLYHPEHSMPYFVVETRRPRRTARNPGTSHQRG